MLYITVFPAMWINWIWPIMFFIPKNYKIFLEKIKSAEETVGMDKGKNDNLYNFSQYSFKDIFLRCYSLCLSDEMEQGFHMGQILQTSRHLSRS